MPADTKIPATCPRCHAPQEHHQVCANCILRDLEERERSSATLKKAGFQAMIAGGTALGFCLQVLKIDITVSLIASAIVTLVIFTLLGASSHPFFSRGRQKEEGIPPSSPDYIPEHMPPTPEGQGVQTAILIAVLMAIVLVVVSTFFPRAPH